MIFCIVNSLYIWFILFTTYIGKNPKVLVINHRNPDAKLKRFFGLECSRVHWCGHKQFSAKNANDRKEIFAPFFRKVDAQVQLWALVATDLQFNATHSRIVIIDFLSSYILDNLIFLISYFLFDNLIFFDNQFYDNFFLKISFKYKNAPK